MHLYLYTHTHTRDEDPRPVYTVLTYFALAPQLRAGPITERDRIMRRKEKREPVREYERKKERKRD